MAKQVGEFPIIGTIDGLNFYCRKGQYLVRLKPGPKGKTFRTHPHFERPRAQSRLFSRISSGCGQLRRQLRWGRARVFDGNINGRMMRLFSQISHLDPDGSPGERVWQRALHLPQAAGLLSGFAFHEDHPIRTVLRAEIDVVRDPADRLILSARPRQKMVRLPEGCTRLGVEFLRISVPADRPFCRDGSVEFPPTEATAFPRQVELALPPPKHPGPWLLVLRLVPYHEDGGSLIRVREAVQPTEIVGIGLPS